MKRAWCRCMMTAQLLQDKASTRKERLQASYKTPRAMAKRMELFIKILLLQSKASHMYIHLIPDP